MSQQSRRFNRSTLLGMNRAGGNLQRRALLDTVTQLPIVQLECRWIVLLILQHQTTANPVCVLVQRNISLSLNNLGDTNPLQWVNPWTDPFNPQCQFSVRDTSKVPNPSCHRQQGNPSFSTPHLEQMGGMFDPSSCSLATPFADPLYWEQWTAQSFSPASYIR